MRRFIFSKGAVLLFSTKTLREESNKYVTYSTYLHSCRFLRHLFHLSSFFAKWDPNNFKGKGLVKVRILRIWKLKSLHQKTTTTWHPDNSTFLPSLLFKDSARLICGPKFKLCLKKKIYPQPSYRIRIIFCAQNSGIVLYLIFVQ